jgi:prepilin-type N-terminal cleavage/methylation domain-containing protein
MLKRNFFWKKKGLSFIEVLVTVAILGSGIVMIYKAFFVSLDYMNHLTYRLHANILLDNKINELQREYKGTDEITFSVNDAKVEVMVNNKPVDYIFGLSYRKLDNISDLLEVKLRLSWVERNRRLVLSRSAVLSKY